MSVPLVLFAYPPRKNETCRDEEHDQWDWPKRISKPTPKPEKDRNQQQRKKQREQVSQHVDEHHPPASLADYSQQIALDLHRRGKIGLPNRSAGVTRKRARERLDPG